MLGISKFQSQRSPCQLRPLVDHYLINEKAGSSSLSDSTYSTHLRSFRMNESFQELLDINRGHFQLESGLHGDVWFDLEKVFLHPKVLVPFIKELAALIDQYNLSTVCGAMVGGVFVAYSVAETLGLEFIYTERHVNVHHGAGYEVSYKLPQALRSAVADRKVGIIDDVINAGSAVTKTYEELKGFGANTVVLASLLTVGGKSPKRLSRKYPPIVALEHLESNLWKPSDCPLCKSGKPLSDPYRAERS
jgi:orotate phosphoribosyltransferase